MNKTVAVVSLALAAMGVTGSAASAQTPTQDSVTGSFTTGFSRSDLILTFDVHSGPSGESPTGTVEIRTFVAGGLGTFAVSCLGVGGNRATVVVPFPPAAPPIPAAIVLLVEDNGSSGDRVDWSFVSTVPAVCPPPSTVAENLEPFGDVTVVDAQPFPTARDQCKNGGWRDFGSVFRNQGDCVSYVATRERNRPAGGADSTE
jgi:hypothetical protein